MTRGEGAQRLNDLMTLSVFPDHVTDAVLDSVNRHSDMTVAQVLGHLRNWDSGSIFRDMVIEKVNSQQKLYGKDLQNLAEQAKDIASRAESSNDKSLLNAATEEKSKRKRRLLRKRKRSRIFCRKLQQTSMKQYQRIKISSC